MVRLAPFPPGPAVAGEVLPMKSVHLSPMISVRSLRGAPAVQSRGRTALNASSGPDLAKPQNIGALFGGEHGCRNGAWI